MQSSENIATPCSKCGQSSYRKVGEEWLCRRHFLLAAWSINTGVDNLGIILFFQKVIPRAFKSFKYGIPRFHREILWEALLDNPRWTFNDRKVVIAAPRGSSKTTLLSKGLVLYLALFGLKRYIVIASKTGRAAQKNLRWVRNMIGSSAVIGLFGDLRPVVRGKRMGMDEEEGIWSKDIITLTNGVVIEALGMGQQFRSAAEGEDVNRIDLFIADDTETDENTKTPDRRESNETWLFETVLPSLDVDTGTVIFINTLTHTESILAKLLKSTGWRKKEYALSWVNDNGKEEFLWPEKFPPAIIEAIKQDYETIGRLRSFYKEYYNVIRSEKGFNDAWIKYYQGEAFTDGGRVWLKVRHSESDLEKVVPAYTTLGIDLSASFNERADWTVLVPLATIRGNQRYVLPFSRGRYATYDDYDQDGKLLRKGVISEAIRLYEKYLFSKIVIDAAGNQLATYHQLLKEFSNYPHPPQIIPYRATGEKFVRLRDLLEPEYQLGRIHHLRSMQDLHRELVSFGETTDDILDALFNAIKYATEPMDSWDYSVPRMPLNDELRAKQQARKLNWMVV